MDSIIRTEGLQLLMARCNTPFLLRDLQCYVGDSTAVQFTIFVSYGRLERQTCLLAFPVGSQKNST
jgi:hypothetical protein